MLGGGASVIQRGIRTQDGLRRFFTLLDDKVNAEGFERILGQLSGGVSKKWAGPVFHSVPTCRTRNTEKERFLAEGQSQGEENIPAHTRYRRTPLAGDVVLCTVEPCGLNGTEQGKMYDDNRLEFGTKYCCDVFNNNRNEKQITKSFRLKIRVGSPTFLRIECFFDIWNSILIPWISCGFCKWFMIWFILDYQN